jgi:uncharacterized protein (TIGR03437 family)
VVTVGALELEAPLYFVSPGQINLQLPFEALGSPLPIIVTTPEGKSKPLVLTLAASGPGITVVGVPGFPCFPEGRVRCFAQDTVVASLQVGDDSLVDLLS